MNFQKSLEKKIKLAKQRNYRWERNFILFLTLPNTNTKSIKKFLEDFHFFGK